MPERNKKGNPSKHHQQYQNATAHGQPVGTTSTPTAIHNTAGAALAAQGAALNPPFDPRMRRVGSPLNLAANIKRGWIQSVDGLERVNFLFNPAALELASSQVGNVKSPLQAADTVDVMRDDYASTGSSTSLSLLYDRTYELFSNGPTTNSAVTFGAFADIIAWYKFFRMLDAIPTSWSGTIFTQPMMRIPSYLFVGPSLYVYGFANSLSITITHWTQFMIPQRAKVDLSFTILPLPSGSAQILHVPGSTDTGINLGAALQGWAGTLFGGSTTEEGDQ